MYCAIVLSETHRFKSNAEVRLSLFFCGVYFVLVSLVLHDPYVCFVKREGMVGFEPRAVKAVYRHTIRMGSIEEVVRRIFDYLPQPACELQGFVFVFALVSRDCFGKSADKYIFVSKNFFCSLF